MEEMHFFNEKNFIRFAINYLQTSCVVFLLNINLYFS